MRLEPLCHVTMTYGPDSSWQRPFGTPDDPGEEEYGFGTGEGGVTGDVFKGSMRWANFPRRREDGVWTPDLRGYITADDGGELIVSIRGLSIDETSPHPRRAIAGRLEFTTEHHPLKWLNTAFVVGEGEIDATTGVWWLDAFVCVNETVEYPPAIGSESPARFRQGRQTT